MARCYSAVVAANQTLPKLWLISDARNDAAIAATLARMPRGSGLVFRHYHLELAERSERFRALRRMARRHGHLIALAGKPRLAREWGADAVYGAPKAIAGTHGLLRIATVHGFRELGAAKRVGADLVMISPVFATRSHPGAATLGPVRARLLARMSQMPVVFLGGMTPRRGRAFAPYGWAAIDGLCRDTHRACALD